jgi:hypothetical protein
LEKNAAREGDESFDATGTMTGLRIKGPDAAADLDVCKKECGDCKKENCTQLHSCAVDIRLGGKEYIGIVKKRATEKTSVRLHGHLVAVHPELKKVSVVVTMKLCDKTKALDHFEVGPGMTAAMVKPSNPSHLEELVRKYGSDALERVVSGKRRQLIRLTVGLSLVSPAATRVTSTYRVGTRILVKDPSSPNHGCCGTVIGKRQTAKVARFGRKTKKVLQALQLEPGTHLDTSDPLIIEFDNVNSSDTSNLDPIFKLQLDNHILAVSFDHYEPEQNLVVFMDLKSHASDPSAHQSDVTFHPNPETEDGMHESPSPPVDEEAPYYGTWTLVTVDRRIRYSRYLLRIGDETSETKQVDLNEVNHFFANLGTQSYETELKIYLEGAQKNDTVKDGITGSVLRIADQTVAIDIEETSSHSEFTGIKNVFDLCAVLSAPSNAKRANGHHDAHPVLIKAGPGTGKTWMTKQAMIHLSRPSFTPLGVRYVPFLVPIPKLAQRLLEEGMIQPSAVDGASKLTLPGGQDLLEWFIEHGNWDPHLDGGRPNTSQRSMMLDAYHSKRLLLILDGLDEAPHLKDPIKDFVLGSLVAGSHRVLLTSRPEGVDIDLSGYGFVVLNLATYSAEQQRNVLKQQSEGEGRKFMGHLLDFSEGLNTMDAIVEEPSSNSNDLQDLQRIAEWHAIEKLKEVKCGFRGSVAARSCPRGEDCNGDHSNDPGDDVQFTRSLSQDADGNFKVATTYAEVKEVGELVKLHADVMLDAIAATFSLPTTSVTGGGWDKDTAVADGVGALVKVPIKGEDRVNQKAVDKYKGNVARCYDIVRYSFVCPDAATVNNIFNALKDSNSFEIVRSKNYFRKLDAVHYRRFGLTIRTPVVGYEGLFHNLEIQLHLVSIWKRVPSHTHYEYFRSLFKTSIDQQLSGETDGWLTLDDRIRSWSTFIRTPVLMALLVVILSNLKFDAGMVDIAGVPSSTSELYSQAIQIIIDRTCPVADAIATADNVLLALQQLSFRNHCPKIERQFNLGDVKEALRYRATNQFEAFTLLLKGSDEYRLPTLKVLENRGAGNEETSFHSVHLSLQEYLAGQHITVELDPDNEADFGAERRARALQSIGDVSQFISAAKYKNLFTLATPKLADGLFKILGRKTLDLSRDGLVNLTMGTWTTKVKVLRFALLGTGDPKLALVLLAALTDSWQCLRHLEISSGFNFSLDQFHQQHSLSTVLQGHKHLRTLILSNSNLADINKVLSTLTECDRLVELGLENCGLDHTHHECIERLLDGTKTLKTVNFARNQIGIETRISLVGWIDADLGSNAEELLDIEADGSKGSTVSHHRLSSLVEEVKDQRLKRSAKFDGGAEKIRRARRASLNHPTVSVLDLEGCNLLPCDEDWLIRTLRNSQFLLELVLNNNKFDQKKDVCDEIGARIVSALRESPIQKLSYLNANLGSQTAQAICDILQSQHSMKAGATKGLVELDLSQNPLGDDSGANIVRGLSGNETLISLTMQSALLGPKTGKQLEIVVKKAKGRFKLKRIDFGHNKLGTRGAKPLFQTLQLKNDWLEEIFFNDNGINDHQYGGEVFGKVIGDNNSMIKKLDLSGNKIGKDAVLELAKNLARDRVLQYVDISGSLIRSGEGSLLCTELAKSLCTSEKGTLKVLKMTNNKVGTKSSTTLDKIRGHPMTTIEIYA